MIKREMYLKKIRPFYDIDLVKVIIGIRRCGKSTIMNQIVEELILNNIPEEQIIYINFEFKDYSFIKNDDDLHNYIKTKIKNKEKYYLFFDEIGNIESWEKAINSFKASMNVSLFITGSNSDLLSSDLATHLAGRYVSFKVLPFSFKEVCDYKKLTDSTLIEKEFNDYLVYGGLPQRFNFINYDQTKAYLSDVFDSIIIKDIITRFNIKEIDLFNRILEYLITTPSQFFSAESITKYFMSDKNEVSKTTIYNYLDYLVKANVISKADKYDIRGKRLLTGKYKYYLTDLGFSSIISAGKRKQKGAFLENIVYNELISNGYEVKVGSLISGEVDFIAIRYDEVLYFQVAYLLDDEKVIDREFGNLEVINDGYPKYVLSTDKMDFSQNGIIHKNIIEWLLEEKN